jgi:DNA-binding NtrC family response regulator
VGGNKSRAADWLDVPRRTLYRRLEEYGVTPEP